MAPTSDLENDLEDAAVPGVSSQDKGMATAEAERAAAAPSEDQAPANAAKTDDPVVGLPETEAAQAGAAEALLTEVVVAVREFVGASERYHARAQQREGVIDYLRGELDLLRRGERRGLLRPVLTDLCRLRDDLLKQAATLPDDFDAAKAADLLRSYAETIELTLESNGVITFTPNCGDSFDPRMHRRVSAEATADAATAGRVAGIRRDGYLDIESNSPIAPAEVTVFAAMKGEQ